LIIYQVLALSGSKEQVDFSNEKLCLSYSDIWEDNFIITETGQIYVIDFEAAAFLPTSLTSFVLHKPAKPLVPKVSARISFPQSANLSALHQASYVLKISSDPRIGK